MPKLITIHIPLGYALAFTSDAVTSGQYTRLGNPGGSVYSPAAFSTSTTTTVGPFNEPRDYQLSYQGNDFSYTRTQSGVNTAADDATIALLAPIASPTFTGTVVLPSTTSIGDVSATEVGYVNGVTSALQTQLNAKAPLASPTFTGAVNLPSDTTIGSVSSTELGYIDTLTSSAQTQIDSKLAARLAPFDQTGDGAIAFGVGNYHVKISKGSAAALTLAAPTEGTHDGSILIVTSTTDFAHVITATSLLEVGLIGGSKTTVTFAAYKGAAIMLMAIGARWFLLNQNAVVIT